MEYLPPLTPEFTAKDWDLDGKGSSLEISVREDKTLSVRVVGKQGGVKAWLELSNADAIELRDFLLRRV